MAETLTLKTFYEAAVKAGIAQDPRGRDIVEKELAKTKKEYEKITDEKKKEEFDTERLTNPYVDSRLLYGDEARTVKNIIVGVDMETQEVLLTSQLNAMGKEIDLIVAHHPEGRAYANFYEVMEMQAEILRRAGVPITQAEGALGKRIKEVERRVSPANHTRGVDAARLLDIPICCLHTVADNQVQTYLTSLFEEKAPETLEDVLTILKDEPEYAEAAKGNNPPKLFNGSEKNACGKVVVDMTGGTSGSEAAMDQLARAGVGTLVVMHIPEKHREKCEKAYINIVCAGHMASDSVGLNLLFARMMKNTGKTFTVTPASGYIYIDRTHNV